MASFKQHTLFSSIAGIALFPVALLFFEAEVSDAFLISLWCWFAGMLPDLDSDTGRPLDIIFSQMAACLPFLIVVQLPESTQLSTITLVFVAAYYFVKKPLRKIFEKQTVHRGAFHSIPMGFLISLLITLAYRNEGVLAWMIGAGVLVGYLSHLLLDEIFSVDLLRVRVKRSFGTALTLSTGSASLNILLYLATMCVLAGALFMIPFE